MIKPESAIEDPADQAPSAALIWSLSRREAAILSAILLATLVAYMPSVRNGWVFDDGPQIVRSIPLHSWSGIGKSFIYDSWWFLDPKNLPQSAYYRPLQASWFGLNFMIFGNHPAAWHLEKIILQVIAVALCFRLTQLLTRNSSIGLLTAAVFAILPANVESVVWVSAIGEPLSTIFEMAALCCLINRKPGSTRGLVFALVLYTGALLSHETAILFGAIVATYIFLFEDVEGRLFRRVVSAVTGSAPFVFLAMLYMCARLNALGWNSLFGIHSATSSGIVRGFIVAKAHHRIADVVMTLPAAVLDYIGIFTVPWMAGPAHAVHWITYPQPALFLCSAALLVILTAAGIFGWRSSDRSIYIFAAVWSLITIAPALNLNALWYLVDDRYLYAPSFGFCLAAGVALVRLSAAGYGGRTVVVAVSVFLVACAIASVRSEHYWYDDVTFFARCAEIDPTVADYRLKLAASQNIAGDREAAARTYESAVAIAPDDPYMHLMLAHQYQAMGRETDFHAGVFEIQSAFGGAG